MKRACAVTGHKPTRFKFKYQEDYSLCKKIKKQMTEQLKYLYDEKEVRKVYIGGTLGVEMWAGELALRLKEIPGYEEIELVLVIPSLDMDWKWDERSRKRLEFLKRHSVECIVIGTQECRDNYIKKNCYMVDHADFLLAVYDNERGANADRLQAVGYAEKKKKEIILIHPDTAEISMIKLDG